jgi:hypothetical protein
VEKRLISVYVLIGGFFVEGLAQIEQEIERQREELYIAVDMYGFSELSVLEKSRELDALLNQYQRMRD